LEEELQLATLALVSQDSEGGEFNIPSKLMNFMAYGLPVLAAVNPSSEVARLVTASEAGWIVDSREPDTFPRKLAEVAEKPEELRRRGRAARAYAQRHFTREGFAERFDKVLQETVNGRGNRSPAVESGHTGERRHLVVDPVVGPL
jgi:colanic acid biosynthesis glycosyl transferase WcaI